MKEIELSQGYVALVDDEDFESVSEFGWSAHVHLRKDDSIRSVYAVRQVTPHKSQRMHRFILGVEDSAVKVDHKDHNGLNNQRYNLRTTKTQNNQNARIRPDNTSGFKGVYWNKDKKLWQAQILVAGKRKCLGRFIDPLEAACAYDMAAVKYFGEFACCNFARP